MNDHLAGWNALVSGGTLMLVAANVRAIRGTTFVGPWAWCVGALTVLCGGEALVAMSFASGPTDVIRLRYVAAVTTLCPAMAVLGAKRPQNRAWHLIVLSLWVVLVLPAAESYFIRPGAILLVPTLLGLLLWAVIVTEIGNYLATRFWLAALCVATGQTLLLAGQLPGTSTLTVDARGTWAQLLLLLGALQVISGRPSHRVSRPSLDCAWLDFRDMYGVVWALRVAERLNTAGEKQGCSAQLDWKGFRPRQRTHAAGMPDLVVTPSMQRSFRMLLRRFVSAKWLEARLDETL